MFKVKAVINSVMKLDSPR